jgi:hypothetical protein
MAKTNRERLKDATFDSSARTKMAGGIKQDVGETKAPGMAKKYPDKGTKPAGSGISSPAKDTKPAKGDKLNKRGRY